MALLSGSLEAAPKCCPVYDLPLTKGLEDAYFMLDFVPYNDALTTFNLTSIKAAFLDLWDSTVKSLPSGASAGILPGIEDPAEHLVVAEFVTLLGGVRTKGVRLSTSFKADVSVHASRALVSGGRMQVHVRTFIEQQAPARVRLCL